MYSANTFTDILNKIQKSVDDLSLNAYSNLHAWVAKLDESVEQKLAGRLEAGIKAWTKVLEGKIYYTYIYYSIFRKSINSLH